MKQTAKKSLPTRLVSRARMDLTIALANYTLRHGVPGDFIEAGVYAGASSIAMAKVL